MKVNYKNCEIECFKENECLYYSIFDEDGFEVDSGYSYCNDTVRGYIECLKKTVDDYIEHPENYRDDEECETLQISNEDNEEEERYMLTPKGIAILSLLQCGLVNDMNDQRVEGFWMLFENGMRKSGYIQEEE